MIRFLTLLILLASTFIFAREAEAKTLPQALKLGTHTTASHLSGSSLYVGLRLRADRRALIVSFGNLQNTTSVSYLLTYNTNGQQEGAMGALKLDGSPTYRQELLFGTCSKNVCTYNTNISNTHFEVTYTTQSGHKYIKRFRIKV